MPLPRIIFLIFLLIYTGCAGHLPQAGFSGETNAPLFSGAMQHMDTDQDKEFQIPDLTEEKVTLQEKSGYVLLGIGAAALTVAAVVVPIVLLKD